MRDFQQPSPRFNAYDPGIALTDPDISTPARAAAVQLENEIRRDAMETGAFIAPEGRILLRRTGFPNRVSYLPEELVCVQGKTFTHNHPGAASFSLEDLLLAADLQLHEVRVVTARFRHGAAALPNLHQDQWRTAYDLEYSRQRVRLAPQVRADALHLLDFGFEVRHLVWVELSRQLGFIYWRENS